MRSGGWILGIDEAGRGPLIGPMIYACVAHRIESADSQTLKAKGYRDSKKLSPIQREKIYQSMQKDHNMRIETRSISALEISDGATRGKAGNLNNLSQDAAIELIARFVDKEEFDVREIYVDAVGSIPSYTAKLTKRFPTVPLIKVSAKADDLYPIVGAASIVAKVTRDRELAEIGKSMDDGDWGSGYPSDPKTKAWLNRLLAKGDGFDLPDCIRTNWGTIAKARQNCNK